MSNFGLEQMQPYNEVLFFDDFNLEKLNRSKWNVRTTGEVHNNEQQAYIDSNETIYIVSGEKVKGNGNGVLVLHPRYHQGFLTQEGKRFDFVSGRIDTSGKFDFVYGTAAARMMLPPGSGFWPAFWIYGYGKWPDSGEIDVMEYVGEPDWVSSAVHGPGYFGEAGLVNKYYFPTGDNAAAWHIYSVDWTPEKLIFKIDGRATYRVTRPMTDFFGSWVFENKKYLILNFALGGTYPFKTSGVQFPYYGIPESTVRSIKNDEAKVLVDWIHVSR